MILKALIFFLGITNTFSIGLSLDFSEIVLYNRRLLTCLEKSGQLNYNASYQIVTGLAELYEILKKIPVIDPEKRDAIEYLKSKEEVFFRDGLVRFADNPEVQLLWNPQSWGNYGDFTFGRGMVPSRPSASYSIDEVLKRTLSTELTSKCYSDLLKVNGASATPRTCNLSCEDLNYTPDNGYPVAEKMGYLWASILLNCSNIPTSHTLRIVKSYCKEEKKDVDSLFAQRSDPRFKDVLYYYLNKIFLCGTYGVSEFFSKNLLALVVNNMDRSGCVGAERGKEEKQSLTATTLGLMNSVLRYLLEEDAGMVRVVRHQSYYFSIKN